MKKLIFPLSLSAGITLIDQISKWLVKRFLLLDGPSFPIIGQYVQFTYIENPGMAFGIHVGNAKWFFTILSVLVSIGVFTYLSKTDREQRWLRIALSFILGGAVGNLIDRVIFGRVVDFIHVGYKSFYWPIFNIADSAVSIGMIILMLLVIFEKDPSKSALPASPENRGSRVENNPSQTHV